MCGENQKVEHQYSVEAFTIGGGFRAVLLGGSWVVISRVITRVTILITHIRGLIAPLATRHEPPSNR